MDLVLVLDLEIAALRRAVARHAAPASPVVEERERVDGYGTPP
jgi:hypothetical protein